MIEKRIRQADDQKEAAKRDIRRLQKEREDLQRELAQLKRDAGTWEAKARLRHIRLVLSPLRCILHQRLRLLREASTVPTLKRKLLAMSPCSARRSSPPARPPKGPDTKRRTYPSQKIPESAPRTSPRAQRPPSRRGPASAPRPLLISARFGGQREPFLGWLARGSARLPDADLPPPLFMGIMQVWPFGGNIGMIPLLVRVGLGDNTSATHGP